VNHPYQPQNLKRNSRCSSKILLHSSNIFINTTAKACSTPSHVHSLTSNNPPPPFCSPPAHSFPSPKSATSHRSLQRRSISTRASSMGSGLIAYGPKRITSISKHDYIQKGRRRTQKQRHRRFKLPSHDSHPRSASISHLV
jgi:hypothetical protein